MPPQTLPIKAVFLTEHSPNNQKHLTMVALNHLIPKGIKVEEKDGELIIYI